MNAISTSFRGEDGAQDAEARAALATLLRLAPHVFPAVAVEDDWKSALARARDVLNRKGMGQ